MQNIIEKFYALFSLPFQKVVGISLEESTLHLVCLEKEATLWQKKNTIKIPLPMHQTEYALWQEASAAIKVSLAKLGLENSRIALCLPDDDGFFYTKEFPPLSNKELSNAVRLDLLASLPPTQAEAAYCMDFQPLASGDVLLAALSYDKAKMIQQAFLDVGLNLFSLCILTPTILENGAAFAVENILSTDESLPPEDKAAFFAAAGLLSTKKICVNLLPTALRPGVLAVGRISAVLFALFFFCLAAIYGQNMYQLHDLKKEQEAIAKEMLLLTAEKQRMDYETTEAYSISKKEQLLLTLSKDALACRSLLVHFGTRTVEGAWIRTLRVVDKKTVEIEGAAISYDALAKFVRSLEMDTGIFQKAPLLKKSERRQDTADRSLIYFSLELHL